MVYVYAKLSELNKFIGKDLSVDEIKSTLADIGMDVKGEESLVHEDKEFKIEITAEKLDMVSTIGIGRAIKYYMEFESIVPRYEVVKGNHQVIVDESAKLCRPKTVAAILRDVPMSQEFLDEIIKVQEKVHDSFGRGRKKAAIGIYPLDKIDFPVYYKSEEPKNIKFKPLDIENEMHGQEILEKHETGKKFKHLLEGYKLFPVFRDSSDNVLSMPPIINSNDIGKVGLEHKNLFVECTGHNLQLLDNILKVLVTTFIEMGARVESVKVEYESEKVYELCLENSIDSIDLDYINSLIGVDIKIDEIEKFLGKMMYGVKSIEGKRISVEIPVFKSDVWNDVDIADDVARAYGYNNIIAKLPNISFVGETLRFSDFKERVSQTLVQLGFLETYTYMLTSTSTQFKKMNLDEQDFEYVKLIDSADQGINIVRISILPESLETLHINRKNKYPQKIFENGFIIQVDKTKDTGARNESLLTVSIADSKSNYTQIKGILDTVLKLNEIKFEVRPSEQPFFIEGRRAEILVKGKIVGFIGEVHPQVLENFSLLVPVSSFEIDLDKIWNLEHMD